jgi:cellulose synthase/poly-beta-1,6-N-acetylglucosamine synthase-like glycosyltransferase
MLTAAEVAIPLGSIAFAGFHGALGRWLLGAGRKPSRRIADAELPSVCVLLPARDEERNLRRLLPALLEQDYPVDRLKIVVVDDRSRDATAGVVAEVGTGRVEVVRVDELPPGIGPKKNALLRGMERCDSEVVLQLDADCLPGRGWVRSMAGLFGPNTGAVCGLVVHADPPPEVAGWFHGIWAVEAMGWAAVQDAAIRNGIPISAHGGNLAYRRRAFSSVGGFGRHVDMVSGDDDFLVQALADSGRWEVVAADHPATLVATEGPRTFREVWEQRKRWGSKCIRYDAKRLLLLSGIYASYLWIAAVLVAGVLRPSFLAWGLLTLAAVTAEGWLLVRRHARNTGRTRLLRWFWLAAIVQVPMVLAATCVGTFGRFRWRDGWTRARRTK